MGVPAKPAAANEATAEAVLSPGGAYKTFIQMILDKAAAVRTQAEPQEAALGPRPVGDAALDHDVQVVAIWDRAATDNEVPAHFYDAYGRLTTRIDFSVAKLQEFLAASYGAGGWWTPQAIAFARAFHDAWAADFEAANTEMKRVHETQARQLEARARAAALAQEQAEREREAARLAEEAALRLREAAAAAEAAAVRERAVAQREAQASEAVAANARRQARRREAEARRLTGLVGGHMALGGMAGAMAVAVPAAPALAPGAELTEEDERNIDDLNFAIAALRGRIAEIDAAAVAQPAAINAYIGRVRPFVDAWSDGAILDYQRRSVFNALTGELRGLVVTRDPASGERDINRIRALIDNAGQAVVADADAGVPEHPGDGGFDFENNLPLNHPNPAGVGGAGGLGGGVGPGVAGGGVGPAGGGGIAGDPVDIVRSFLWNIGVTPTAANALMVRELNKVLGAINSKSDLYYSSLKTPTAWSVLGYMRDAPALRGGPDSIAGHRPDVERIYAFVDANLGDIRAWVASIREEARAADRDGLVKVSRALQKEAEFVEAVLVSNHGLRGPGSALMRDDYIFVLDFFDRDVPGKLENVVNRFLVKDAGDGKVYMSLGMATLADLDDEALEMPAFLADKVRGADGNEFFATVQGRAVKSLDDFAAMPELPAGTTLANFDRAATFMTRTGAPFAHLPPPIRGSVPNVPGAEAIVQGIVDARAAARADFDAHNATLGPKRALMGRIQQFLRGLELMLRSEAADRVGLDAVAFTRDPAENIATPVPAIPLVDGIIPRLKGAVKDQLTEAMYRAFHEAYSEQAAGPDSMSFNDFIAKYVSSAEGDYVTLRQTVDRGTARYLGDESRALAGVATMLEARTPPRRRNSALSRYFKRRSRPIRQTATVAAAFARELGDPTTSVALNLSMDPERVLAFVDAEQERAQHDLVNIDRLRVAESLGLVPAPLSEAMEQKYTDFMNRRNLKQRLLSVGSVYQSVNRLADAIRATVEWWRAGDGTAEEIRAAIRAQILATPTYGHSLRVAEDAITNFVDRLVDDLRADSTALMSLTPRVRAELLGDGPMSFRAIFNELLRENGDPAGDFLGAPGVIDQLVGAHRSHIQEVAKAYEEQGRASQDLPRPEDRTEGATPDDSPWGDLRVHEVIDPSIGHRLL